MGKRVAKVKPFVVYWNNIPTPYMVERFNALASRGNIVFEAWFNERLESDRSWDVNEETWQFKYKYLPNLRIFGKKFRMPVPLWARTKPDVVVSLYAEPVFIVGWVVSRIRSFSLLFWCQVTHDNWVRRRRWKQWIKKKIFSSVDGTVGSGEESRRFAMRFGVTSENAKILRHSIDVAHFASGATISPGERKELRQNLGLIGVTFIYVGRLWWGKGIEYLLEAFRIVQRDLEEETSLLILGDGSEEQALKKQCFEQNIKNVVFAGFQQKPSLPRYYGISDVFVFPTLGDPYGLVVDEAMASGLPIISTSAAGEIRDRVESGVNGYIVPAKDAPALANAMLSLGRDGAVRRRMGEMSATKIRGHTPEQWAKDFENIIDSIIQGRSID